MTIYLLHFDAPIGHAQSDERRALHGLPPRRGPYVARAQHYLGYTEELWARLYAHHTGNGTRLVQVANERGISWRCVRVWQGDRKDERRTKNRKEGPRFCPICSERPRDPGLEEVKTRPAFTLTQGRPGKAAVGAQAQDEPVTLSGCLDASLALGHLPEWSGGCTHRNTREEGNGWKWCLDCGARYNPRTGRWEL